MERYEDAPKRTTSARRTERATRPKGGETRVTVATTRRRSPRTRCRPYVAWSSHRYSALGDRRRSGQRIRESGRIRRETGLSTGSRNPEAVSRNDGELPAVRGYLAAAHGPRRHYGAVSSPGHRRSRGSASQLRGPPRGRRCLSARELTTHSWTTSPSPARSYVVSNDSERSRIVSRSQAASSSLARETPWSILIGTSRIRSKSPLSIVTSKR